MIELRKIEWPPLLLGGNVPRWRQLLDVGLTLLAWGVLFWMMRYTLALAQDFLRPPHFEFSSMSPPNWLELAYRLSPFSRFIAALLLWLLFWALVRRRYLRATEPMTQPPPLSIAAQAADFGLSEETVAPWREARILVVHFGADGHPSHGDVRLRGSPP